MDELYNLLGSESLDPHRVIERIRAAPVPRLGVSREELMWVVIIQYLLRDNLGLIELRKAVLGFERKNPNIGTEEKLNELVDKNLLWICGVADEFLSLRGDYEQKCGSALTASVRNPKPIGGVVGFYEESIDCYI